MWGNLINEMGKDASNLIPKDLLNEVKGGSDKRDSQKLLQTAAPAPLKRENSLMGAAAKMSSLKRLLTSPNAKSFIKDQIAARNETSEKDVTENSLASQRESNN